VRHNRVSVHKVVPRGKKVMSQEHGRKFLFTSQKACYEEKREGLIERGGKKSYNRAQTRHSIPSREEHFLVTSGPGKGDSLEGRSTGGNRREALDFW